MDIVMNFIATILVAVLSLIGIIIQTKSKARQESIEAKIDSLRKESKEGDERINNKMDEARKNGLLRFLVTEMSKIRKGDYVPDGEQKRMLKQAKDEYNSVGGDSYVDDMYDDLRKMEKL